MTIVPPTVEVFSTDGSFFEVIVNFFESLWDYVCLLLNQIVAWIGLLFTTTEMTSIVQYVLPVSLSGIAILTIGAAVVKAIFGR